MKDIYGNVVDLIPTPAEAREIISDTLDHLEAIDYRNGFNDTVLTHLCAGINAQFPNMHWIMWNDCCMVEYAYTERGPNSHQVKMVVEKYLDNDWDLMERWVRVHTVAGGKGAFEMPSWGTYGT